MKQQEHQINLADTPNKEKGWPISVGVKDHEGNIIDTLDTEISFEFPEEKKEEQKIK